jgi:lipopolysaccharide export LptBFGC system permease protein LptF
LPETTGRKTLAILSIVFGAVSIVFAWILPIIWILLAIAAVVLGFVSRRREPSAKTLATIGIVLGFIGIVANIASMVAGAMYAASVLQNM